MIAIKDFAVPTLAGQRVQLGRNTVDWQLISLMQYVRQTRDSVERRKPTQTGMALLTLMQSFEDVALAYYCAAVQLTQADTPTLRAHRLYSAVTKLTREWMQIVYLVQAAALSASPATVMLARIVEGALKSLNVRRSNTNDQIGVIPLYGDRFALLSPTYAEDLYLLSIPVFDLYTPWRWSVVWHEVAGLLVRRQEIRDMIHEFVEHPVDGVGAWGEWYESWKHVPPPIDDANQPDPIQVLTGSTPLKITIEPEEGYDREGWIQEFIEDACSILALGPTAYNILKNILIENYDNLNQPNDARHPPPVLRLESAYHLLELMRADPNRQIGDVAAFDARLADIRQNREGLHGRALDDSNVIRIAQWIYEAKATHIITDSTLSSPLSSLARKIVIESYEKLYTIDLSSLDSDHADRLVNRIWKDAQAELQAHDELIRSSSVVEAEALPAPSYVNIKGQAQDIISKIEKCVQLNRWINLEAIELSQIDPAIGVNNLDHASHTANKTLTVSISGSSHNKNHSKSFSWTHGH